MVSCLYASQRSLMISRLGCLTFAAVLSTAMIAKAQAQDSIWDWFYGGWSMTLGGAGYVEPEYEGADSYHISGMPLFSIGRTGSLTRFSSINDRASIAFFDNGVFRTGP